MSYYILPVMPMSMKAGLKKSPYRPGDVVQQTAGGIVSSMTTMPYQRWKFEFSLDSVTGQESTATSVVAAMLAAHAQCGRVSPFLFTDPQDSFVTAAQFGTGNGADTAFQLSRNIDGAVDIIQFLNGTPNIFVNGTLTTPASISSTGVVTFSSAPASSAALTWSGEFYFLCRFDEDSLDATRSFTVNNGTDQWNFQGITFTSEFITTASYGDVAAAGGGGGGGGTGGGGAFSGGTFLTPIWSNPLGSQAISTYPLSLPLLDSSSANIATTGFISLANTDTIVWRNAANSANLALGVNTSNQLIFNGSAVGGGTGTVTASGTPTSGQLAQWTTATNIDGVSIASLNLALTTGTLGQFAATTSAALAGVISDETGSGALVFATSPTLVTPLLGTPTSGNLANCTFPTLNQNTSGTAANLSGTPALPNGTTATTQTAGDNSTKLATTAYVATAVAGGGGGNLSTSGTITSGQTAQFNGTSTVISVANTGTGSYVLAASPALTGVPTAPTAALATNTTQIATTAFVIANAGSGGSPAFSAVTAGTNTAALVVGTAGTLKPTSTGLIQATNGNALNNVKVSGAVGNGSTNDHTDIQAAFTAVSSTNPGVYFPANASSDSYVNSSAVTDPTTGDLQFILGEGDLSGMSTAGTNNLLTLTHVTDNTSINGFRMTNMTFSGNTTPTSIGTQTLVALSNANSNSSGGDCSGLTMENLFFFNSAGPCLTVAQPILYNAKNLTYFGSAQGVVYTNTGTTIIEESTYGNEILASARTFNGQQCIGLIGTAGDSCGTQNLFIGASGIFIGAADGESGQAWQQSITTVVATSTLLTFTVANTYVAGNIALVTGGLTTNATLNGRWVVNTASSTQFTVTVSGFTPISSNSPSGMKSSVYSGDQHVFTANTVCGGSIGTQMFTPVIPQSAYMVFDGTSGLFHTIGYSNNSGGTNNDIILMKGALPTMYDCSAFGATEANAILATGGGNYSLEACTFNSGSLGASWQHIVLSGNPTYANGIFIENSTLFASTGGAGFKTQYHNSSDTNISFESVHAGSSALHFVANNGSANVFAVNQAGVPSTVAGLTTAALGVPVPIFVQNSSLAFGTFNTGAAVTMETGTAGLYRVTFNLVITTLFATNTAVTLSFGWTDDSGARTMTLTGAALTSGTAIPAFSATAVSPNSFTFHSTSAAITYTPAKTGSAATAGAAYVNVYLERLA